MESWKLTLADGIVSFSKSGKKNIQIVTKDSTTGQQVAQAIITGVKTGNPPLSTDFKGVSRSDPDNWNRAMWGSFFLGDPLAVYSTTLAIQGLNSWSKEFYVETGSKEGQEEFIERLERVLAEVQRYKNGASNPTPTTSTAITEQSVSKSNTTLIIVAIVAVAAIVWALWKKK